jgi:hypothetical protein
MAVFRMQNNVPQVYVNESRDFQLMGRVMDVIHGGVMFDASSIINLIRPLNIYDSLLIHYATKVGFFPKVDIDAKVLRPILAAFPFAVKNKGSIRGIEYAVASVLRAENIPSGDTEIIVSIDKTTHQVLILIQFQMQYKYALEEVLKYVIPAGFDFAVVYSKFTDPIYDTYHIDDSMVAFVGKKVYTSGQDGHNPSGIRSVSSINNKSASKDVESSMYVGDIGSLKPSTAIPSPKEAVVSGVENDLVGAFDTNTIIPSSSQPIPQNESEQQSEESNSNEEQ